MEQARANNDCVNPNKHFVIRLSGNARAKKNKRFEKEAINVNQLLCSLCSSRSADRWVAIDQFQKVQMSYASHRVPSRDQERCH
jgi:hypothetical protein